MKDYAHRPFSPKYSILSDGEINESYKKINNSDKKVEMSLKYLILNHIYFKSYITI